jgi:hypothetical protein
MGDDYRSYLVEGVVPASRPLPFATSFQDGVQTIRNNWDGHDGGSSTDTPTK